MKYEIKKNEVTGGECTHFEHKGQHYYADRSFVHDYHCIETMIFKCDENENVTDWSELYCDRTGKSLTACVEEFVKYLNKKNRK